MENFKLMINNSKLKEQVEKEKIEKSKKKRLYSIRIR